MARCYGSDLLSGGKSNGGVSKVVMRFPNHVHKAYKSSIEQCINRTKEYEEIQRSVEIIGAGTILKSKFSLGEAGRHFIRGTEVGAQQRHKSGCRFIQGNCVQGSWQREVDDGA